MKQEVLVHLGVHETPEAAQEAWPPEAEHLRRIGRAEQAGKLEAKLGRLRGLIESTRE